MNKTIKILLVLFTLALLALQLGSCTGADTDRILPENIQEKTADTVEENVYEDVDTYTPLDVMISEIMAKNHASVMTDGAFPDWIELKNNTARDISLKNWQITNGRGSWHFADVSIKAGGYLAVYSGSELMAEEGISFTDKDTVHLLSPEGTEIHALEVEKLKNDQAYALKENGEYEKTYYATPGYENSRQGYEAWCSSQPRTDAVLVINEAANADNVYYAMTDGAHSDWIELKNVSGEAVELSEYFLSDKSSDKLLWRLPEYTLQPGELYVIDCTDDGVPENITAAPFSLAVPTEGIWLTREDGAVADSIFMHDVPVNGSIGREEGGNGLYYYEEPTPGSENHDGKRCVLSAPVASVPQMTYNGVESLSIELSAAEGTVYYTTDCTLPAEANWTEYTGAIVATENTVIRAVAVKDGYCRSRVSTFSYIINENKSLPVVSLVLDDFEDFSNVYYKSWKNHEETGVMTLFDGEERFTANCGVLLKGWTSLSLPKKSLGIYFRGRYGDGAAEYDVFGNGISKYSSLSLRAGQDYTFSVIRNELFQGLCAEASESLITQNGKYCVVYINGQYWGLYCLKENVNEHFISDTLNVSSDSVSIIKSPVDYKTDLENLIEFVWYHDMADEENYRYFTDQVNIDSVIDWIIFEGYSANSDTLGNLKYVSSPEYDDGKFNLLFFDLDWTLRDTRNCFDNIFKAEGNAGEQMRGMANSLSLSPVFREKFLKRFAELITTTFADDYVLARIDELITPLVPEVELDWERWGMDTKYFYSHLEELKSFIKVNDYNNYCVNKVCEIFNVSYQEKQQYFG